MTKLKQASMIGKSTHDRQTFLRNRVESIRTETVFQNRTSLLSGCVESRGSTSRRLTATNARPAISPSFLLPLSLNPSSGSPYKTLFTPLHQYCLPCYLSRSCFVGGVIRKPEDLPQGCGEILHILITGIALKTT